VAFLALGVLLLASLVAACDSSAGGGRAVVAAIPPAAPPVIPLPPTTAAPRPVETAAAPLPAVAPARGTAQLRGLSSLQVTQLLGRPDFLRRDASAEVWQYRTGECVLDLFLYPEGSVQQVAYVEARSRSAAKIASDPCVAALTSRPHNRQASNF
jgi:hypothetical protein